MDKTTICTRCTRTKKLDSTQYSTWFRMFRTLKSAHVMLTWIDISSNKWTFKTQQTNTHIPKLIQNPSKTNLLQGTAARGGVELRAEVPKLTTMYRTMKRVGWPKSHLNGPERTAQSWEHLGTMKSNISISMYIIHRVESGITKPPLILRSGAQTIANTVFYF